MFRKGLSIVLCLLLVLSVFTVIPFSVPAQVVDCAELGVESTGNATFDKFINTYPWRDGDPWGVRGPEIAPYDFGSCGAYAADFTYYCYNTSPRDGSYFSSTSEIQAGDVIVLGNAGDGTGHWFVVLKRNGNSLYTAEGNVGGKVRIGWNYTILSGNRFSEDSRAMTEAIHHGSAPDQNINLGTNFYSTIENPYSGTAVTGVDGNDVKSYALNSSLSQWWKFENCGNNNEYKITNCSYNKCIDVYCADNKNNTNVDLYTSNDTSAQRWYIRSASNGYVLIPKCAGSRCIDIEKVSSEDGANIQIFTCSSNNAQVFKIPYRLQSAPCDFGERFESTIVNTYSGKAVTNKDGSVKLYPVDGSYSQAWGFYRSSNLSYEIFSYCNWGSCLDVANGLPYNNTAVDIYSENNSAAQRWFIIKEGEGKYRLVPQISTGRTLDIKDGNTADGNTFQIYDYNKTNAQYYSIDPDGSFFTPLDYGEHFKAKIVNVGTKKNVVGQADDNVVIHSNDTGNNAVWEFSKNSDGSYYIVNCEYNKRLDLYASLPYNHTNIGLYEANNSYGQRWFLVKSGNDIAFVPACVLMRCMDVKEANPNDGTNIELFSYSESRAQKFSVVRIEDPTTPLLLGDADGGGEVTITDATAIQRHLASIPTYAYNEEAADVDGNGSVSIIDATCIQRHLAQLPAPEGIGKPIS